MYIGVWHGHTGGTMENPTLHLEEMRKLTRRIISAYNGDEDVNLADCLRFANLFEELDEWLVGSGDAPRQWSE